MIKNFTQKWKFCHYSPSYVFQTQTFIHFNTNWYFNKIRRDRC